jgi:hypothetical protein
MCAFEHWFEMVGEVIWITLGSNYISIKWLLQIDFELENVQMLPSMELTAIAS